MNAERGNMPPMTRNVVHVKPTVPVRLSGPGPSDADLRRMQSSTWRARGYIVADIPPGADPLDHPTNRACPTCSDSE